MRECNLLYAGDLIGTSWQAWHKLIAYNVTRTYTAVRLPRIRLCAVTAIYF
jgi:hypothetical protein